MKNVIKQLTVKEAIEQGYESFFYNSDGWQRMRHLIDIGKGETVDWTRDDIYIVEKHPAQCFSLSEDEIKDLILDELANQHDDATGSDDSYNTIKEAFADFDFKSIEDAIDKVLEGVTSYQSTDIKLVP